MHHPDLAGTMHYVHYVHYVAQHCTTVQLTTRDHQQRSCRTHCITLTCIDSDIASENILFIARAEKCIAPLTTRMETREPRDPGPLPVKLNVLDATRAVALAGDSAHRAQFRALRSPLKIGSSESLPPAPPLTQTARSMQLLGQSTLSSPVRPSGSPERRQRILEMELGGRHKKPKTVTVNEQPEIIPPAPDHVPKSVVPELAEMNALLREMKKTQDLLVAEVRELKATVSELQNRSQ